MKFLIFLIVINCVLLYFYLFNPNLYEKYTNTPLLIYDVQENPNKININISELNDSKNVRESLKDLKNVEITENTQDFIVTDALTYKENYESYKVVNIFNDQKYSMFLKPKDKINNENLYDIVNSRKFIGYFNDIDALLIKYICLSQDNDVNTLNLKKINIPNIISEDFFKTNNIYCLYLNISLLNVNFIKKIPVNFKIDFIDCSSIDIDKLKFFIPFSKKNDIDLSIYFTSFKDEFSIKTCVILDLLVIGLSNLEEKKELGLNLNSLIVKIGNYELINYYTQYFKFYKHSYKYIELENNHIKIRDNLPILEQFGEESIESNQNQKGYYDSTKQIFYLSGNTINELPLITHTRVNFKNQNRDEENGNYIVIKTGKESILQKMLFYRDTNLNIQDDMIYINVKEIDGINIEDIKNTDTIYVTQLKNTAKLDKDMNNFKILRLNKNIENPTNDPRYECYNQPQMKSRGLCESTNNIWDRRCEVNTDCPFYQANKNYKNYNGGCIDGYCQMPIGIKNISYRQYDKTTKPYCYNCKDNSPFCCENSENPDYAFAIDEYERKNSYI